MKRLHQRACSRPLAGAAREGEPPVGPQRFAEWHHACALGAATRRLWRWCLGRVTVWVSVAILNPQKLPGLFQVVAVARAKQAVIPDLDQVVRPDMVQEPADECLGRDCADLDCPRLGVLVLEGDLAIDALEEAVVADRHTKDVGSQIVSGMRSTADRFTMHHPVLCPEGVGAKVKHGGLAQCIAHFGPNQEGKRLDRHQESFPGWEPLTAIGSKSTCGHQIVHMGMIVQGASPGVQDPDHPDLAADTPGIQGEVWEGLG